MASVLKLPVIFVCENNGFAVTTSIKKSSNIEDLYIRAAGYGIEGCKIDGNDVLEVYNTALKAVKKARDGGGPS
jgi:pyruvate dehydrogenase E1 component alpha subunit